MKLDTFWAINLINVIILHLEYCLTNFFSFRCNFKSVKYWGDVNKNWASLLPSNDSPNENLKKKKFRYKVTAGAGSPVCERVISLIPLVTARLPWCGWKERFLGRYTDTVRSSVAGAFTWKKKLDFLSYRRSKILLICLKRENISSYLISVAIL